MNDTRRDRQPCGRQPAGTILRWLRVALLLLPCGQVFAGAAPQPFGSDSLAAIEAQHRGQPFVLVLWSVHCAPCFAELKMLGEQVAATPALPLVLVATDGPALAAEVGMVLEDYGLEAVNSWQFAGEFPEKLRYLVDPEWFGELPRSYFYVADGSREGHSGMLTLERLLQFLNDES